MAGKEKGEASGPSTHTNLTFNKRSFHIWWPNLLFMDIQCLSWMICYVMYLFTSSFSLPWGEQVLVVVVVAVVDVDGIKWWSFL